MTAALAAFCFPLGLIIGSFLNVVIWRVPRGESIAHPPSRCPGCGAGIKPYDNIPVVSWLVLRGKCRSCGMRISARYPLVELGTGLVFAGLAVRFGFDAVLPAYLYLGAIAVALTLIDLDVKRLPDAITLPSYAVAGVLLTVAAAVQGDWQALKWAGIGMVALGGFYGLLWVAAPGGMGFGDVKLSGVLGLYLGWLGWPVLLVGWLAGIFVGGLCATVLVAMGAGRKYKVPYGPFLLIGTLIAVYAGEPIARAWLGEAF